MFSFFRKQIKKPVTKNASFYERENPIQSLDDLKNVFNKKATLQTQYKITYQGLGLNEIQSKKLSKQVGEVSYISNHEEKIPGHTIYYYKKHVEKFSLLLQFHFLNDVFFFATTKVSAESLISDKEKQKVLDQLLRHYPDIEIPKNKFTYEFSDPKGNVVSTREHIYIYIDYYANNPEVEKVKAQAKTTIFLEKPLAPHEERLENFI
ncbi:MAG: hypothetical protein Q8O72_00790 [Bacteroidales bacterium]|nr:hypothetical protein [Bacteroidales bacterium]